MADETIVALVPEGLIVPNISASVFAVAAVDTVDASSGAGTGAEAEILFEKILVDTG